MQQLHSLHGRKLLVIDDDACVGLGLRAALDAAGAEVTCLSRIDAVEFIRQREVSAAVLNFQPNTGQARALVRLLTQNHVPFLIHAVEPTARVTTGVGAPFVAKPCPAPVMIRAISFLLRKRRRRYERAASASE